MLRRTQKTFDLAILVGLLFFSEFSFSSDLNERSRLQKNNATHIQAAVETIAHNYLIDIKPIFRQACFDCHTNLTSYPWYYNLPVIKTKIDKDISEGREQLDFSNDYPFMSKGKLTDDLEKIAENLADNSMPPFPYTVMHRTKSINNEQKEKIIDWVNSSLKLLSNAGYVAYYEQ
jgi:hypothetical protein